MARAWLALSILVPFTALAGPSASPSEDDVVVEAQIAVKEAVEPRTKEISIGCNNSPLPTTPIGPTWQTTIDESFIGRTSRYELTAWRKPCAAPDHQLMVTLRPTSGPTTLLSPFAVEQGGRTFNVLPVINEANTAFPGNLTATTTVMLQYIGPRTETFDDEQALAIKVLSLGGPTVTVNIPSVGDTTSPPAFVIDGKVRGAYHDPAMSGQGLLFDVVEGATPMLAAGWYTASPDPLTPGQHEWYTMVGQISGDRATLEIFLTTGQRFMQPTAVATTKVGTATITFTSCANASFQYEIPAFAKAGTVSLVRVTPVPAGCN